MRYLFALLLLAGLIYGGWPYYTYYRLDAALASNDNRQLAELVDLQSVREGNQRASDQRLKQQLPGHDPVSSLVREGARLVGRTTSEEINLDWVRERLRGGPARANEPYPSLVTRTGFAFFESPTGFVARVGELGEAPVFVRMQFRDWQWRVVGVYSCGA